ncbi:MAG: hypothetical protein ABFE13_26425 [Phycisphaerales bacterium]
MRIVWLFAVVCVTLSVPGGCARPENKSKSVEPVMAVTEDGSAFPAALAGLWKSDQQGWEFIFASDGRISSAIIGFGRVRIVPGQTTTTPTQTGGQAVFTPGPWVVHYDPAARMLTVKITMDHVQVPMGANMLEGSSTDTFTGVVSPNMDIWQAQWTAFTDYKARTKDGKSVDLATDDTHGQTQRLVFTKTPVRAR